MVVVAAVLAVIALALAFQLHRTRARLDAVSDDLGEALAGRTSAESARHVAVADAATTRRERDEALEREKRAKREAAEVSRRMKAEVEARRAAEAACQEAEAEVARLTGALHQAEADAASGDGIDGRDAQLWSLALAGVRRTWEVSVAPSPGLPSPLDEVADELRAAISVEVDAAREEAGAAVELIWSGDAVAPPSVAVPALSIAQELIARLAKTSEESVLRVASTDEGLSIEVSGTDADGRSVVPDDVATEHQVAPGRWQVA